MGRKQSCKRKKYLYGKGFQYTVFSNLSEFNTLNGNVPATTLKIDRREIEPHIRQWKTYKKERAGTRFNPFPHKDTF